MINSNKDIEKLKIRAFERQSLELLKTTKWGRIYSIIYLFLGVASIFLYIFIFNISILLSVFLGIITWFFISFIIDTILIKSMRIDKQLEWMTETNDGILILKEKGMTAEQIEDLKKNIKENLLYKQ